jgi:hypothetical protein
VYILLYPPLCEGFWFLQEIVVLVHSVEEGDATAGALAPHLPCGKVQMLQLERDTLRVLLGGRRLWEQIAAQRCCRCVQVNEAWVDHVHDALLGVIDACDVCYDDAYSRVWELLDWINETLATAGERIHPRQHEPTSTLHRAPSSQRMGPRDPRETSLADASGARFAAILKLLNKGFMSLW